MKNQMEIPYRNSVWPVLHGGEANSRLIELEKPVYTGVNLRRLYWMRK